MRWKPLTFTQKDVALIHLGIQALRSRPENHLGATSLEHGR
jgi:hypothetical protein